MRFFAVIKRHPDRFYWLTWAYLFLCLLLMELLQIGPILPAVLILPANLIAWPLSVALLGKGKWRSVRPRVRSALLLLPGVTALLPFYLLYYF